MSINTQHTKISNKKQNDEEEVKENTHGKNEDTLFNAETMELLQMCFTEQELMGDEHISVWSANKNKESTKESKLISKEKNELRLTETNLASELLPSSSLLLLSSSSSPPISLFDANKFIQQKQSNGVPLNVISDDINTYIHSLNTKIEHYVNDDLYSSFVHVSSKFVGIPEELENIHAPVKRLVEEVESLSDTFTRLGNTLQLKLHDAEDAEDDRSFYVYYNKFLLLYTKLQEMNNTLESEYDKTRSGNKHSIDKQNSFTNSLKYNSNQSKHEELLLEEYSQKEKELENNDKEDKVFICSTDSKEHLEKCVDALSQMMLTFVQVQTLVSSLLSCATQVRELEQQRTEVLRYVDSARLVVNFQFEQLFTSLCTKALAEYLTIVEKRNNSYNKLWVSKLESAQEQQGEKKHERELVNFTLREIHEHNEHSHTIINIQKLINICYVTLGAQIIETTFRNYILQPFLTQRYFSDRKRSADTSIVGKNIFNNGTKLSSTESILLILHNIYYDVQVFILPLMEVIIEHQKKTILSTSRFTQEVIWPILVNVFLEHLPLLFDIVDVNGFQQKYIAAHALQALLLKSNLEKDSNNNLEHNGGDTTIIISSNNCSWEIKKSNIEFAKAMQRWEEKWNVELYASVRAGEMHRKITVVTAAPSQLNQISGNALRGDVTTFNNRQSVIFTLSCMNILVREIEYLFSPLVFISACTPVFMREIVQSVNMVAWAMLQYYENKENNVFELYYANSTVNQGSVENIKEKGKEIIDSHDRSTNASVPNEIDDNKNSSKASVKLRELRFALYCMHDLTNLSYYFENNFVSLVKDGLSREAKEFVVIDNNSNSNSNSRSSNYRNSNNGKSIESRKTRHKLSDDKIARQVIAVHAVVSYIRTTLCNSFSESFKLHVVKNVADECVVILQNIKSVRSAYTHTKKPIPTSASWYVQGVIAPIASLINVISTYSLNSEEMSSVVVQTIDTVLLEFISIARETLLIAKKTEESWEKLRRRKEALTSLAIANEGNITTSNANVNDGKSNDTVNIDNSKSSNAESVSTQRVTNAMASDRDKMNIQLYLDAMTILNTLVNLAPYAVPSMQVREQLQTLLRRAEWLRGAEIEEPVDVDELVVS